ncbi:hypothetical protein Tco_0243302 [Tanacetum coccineum]
MAQLKYCDKHNQVGFLLKPAESAGYTEIVDFLRRSKLRVDRGNSISRCFRINLLQNEEALQDYKTTWAGIRVGILEKELSDTKQTLGTAVLQLIKKVKKLKNKLRQKRKREETKDEEDAEGQDQDIPFQTDQGNKFATPEKSKDLGSYKRQIKPAERPVNTGSTPSAQVNTTQSPKERRKRIAMMKKTSAKVQASKKSREQELQELAGLEVAQRLQATMDAETQRQINLDALLARRLVEQEEEAAKKHLQLNLIHSSKTIGDQDSCRKDLQEEGCNI